MHIIKTYIDKTPCFVEYMMTRDGWYIFEIYTLLGQKAHWLKDRMTELDRSRLDSEILSQHQKDD